MRSIWKILGAIVGLIVLGLVAAAAAVYVGSSVRLGRRYTVTVAAVPIPAGAAAIANGKHIATVWGCVACHGRNFGGARVIDDPAMGRVYAPNLTRGEGGLAASLTTEDWVRAVREGVGPDGKPLRIMPSKDYAKMSDQDLGDLLAYATSVPPVDRRVPEITLGPISRLLIAVGKMRLSAEVIDHHRPAPAPMKAEPTAAYGRYLADTCSGCHNPHFSGGKIAEGPPSWPPSANLTSGPGSAIRGWTEQDFIRTLRTMKAPDGRTINPVMPAVFAQMSDTELKALWAFIRTVPPAETGKAPD